MESEIDKIDEKIMALKTTILDKYNESITKINKDIQIAKQDAINKVIQDRAALIKELDDRLALVKQFPSVLEADNVILQDIEANYDFYMSYSGSFSVQPHEMRLKKGKWKVLILAKRID